MERLHSTINPLTMQYFTYNGHSAYNIPSQFNNRCVLVVYQVTTHNKCSKCPPHESVHAWKRLKTDCPGADALVKCPFSIGAQCTTDFNCSQDKNLKD